MRIRNFWFEFDRGDKRTRALDLQLGCGVAAVTLDDALLVIKAKVSGKEELPPIERVTEDIKFSDLDQNHVVPNMGAMSVKGIWYPMI
ncbi:MAG: hypothetical protein AAGA53_15425 [Pseudomonadota bacterium]